MKTTNSKILDLIFSKFFQTFGDKNYGKNANAICQAMLWVCKIVLGEGGIFKQNFRNSHNILSVIVGTFYSNNYIEYESNGDRKKTLSTEEYLNKIRP